MPRNTFNQAAIGAPKPGDYWTERACCPYFIVVKVDPEFVTVLSCLGGEHNARIAGANSWTLDYSKHIVVDRAWMTSKVSYTSGGFVAEVLRDNPKMLAIVEEWKQFHRDRIMEELKQFE